MVHRGAALIDQFAANIAEGDATHRYEYGVAFDRGLSRATSPEERAVIQQWKDRWQMRLDAKDEQTDALLGGGEPAIRAFQELFRAEY